MATIDVRAKGGEEITQIVFADGGEDADESSVFCLSRSVDGVGLESVNAIDYVPRRIESKTDAENLIKALQKAIDLGWWNITPRVCISEQIVKQIANQKRVGGTLY